MQVAARTGAYAGRLVLLTSDITVSAAEVFVLLVSQRDDVHIVGQRTSGAFSDMLFKRLPNGWLLTTSNERYATLDGTTYEAVGIPPDVEVKAFSIDDFARGVDVALDAALGLLHEN